MNICTTFAPLRLRERKMRSEISGLAAWRWRRTNAPSSATPAAPKPSVRGEPQPWPPASRIV